MSATVSIASGALLVTPPDFATPVPEPYHTVEELRAGEWLPIPRNLLPFRSTVAYSQDDPN